MIEQIPYKLEFRRRDVRAALGISNYRIRQLIADGILSEPVKKKGRKDFWVRKQIVRAIEKIEELARPKPIVLNRPRITKPLSEKYLAEARRTRGLPPK